MTEHERRGVMAATVAMIAVGWMAFALLQSAVFAAGGAWALVLAPVVGLAVAAGVFRALRAVCTSGSRRAEALAVLGILALPLIAFFGISFGGLTIVPGAILLAVSAVLTPRPPR